VRAENESLGCFADRLILAVRRLGQPLCVGLDPHLERIPLLFRRGEMLPADPRTALAVEGFLLAILDRIAGRVAVVKPQIAFFEQLGWRGLRVLERVVGKARQLGLLVLLDAKRGDIGSTAMFYAAEAFDRYGADAVTLNPYLGRDSVQPFLDRSDKGVILLCRTSNPGAGDLQDLDVGGQPLYQYLAQRVAQQWNEHSNCMLVVGATYPEELARVRQQVGEMPLLVPGIGAQGGDIEAVLQAGLDTGGNGLIISTSRAVLYAGSGEDFAEAAHLAADRLRGEINRYR